MNYKNTQHLNKIGKAMNKQNEKFNKEMEIIKTKILQLKDTMTEDVNREHQPSGRKNQ